MTKTIKSVLYTMFKSTDKALQLSRMNIVVAGGFLLHRAICHGYIIYIKHYYPGTSRTVVFDGYAKIHNRRCLPILPKKIVQLL